MSLAPTIDLSTARPPATGSALAAPTGVDAAAASSSGMEEQLLAQMLDALTAYLAPDFAIAYLVDEQGFPGTTIVRCAPRRDRGRADTLVRLLRQLEPVDPFSPRRAEAAGAIVLSVAALGGEERYAGTAHGAHLQRHGYRAPLALFLRRGSRVVAGLLFVRDAESAPFGRREARLLGEMHPFLELTFDLSSAPLVAPLPEVPGSADLTAREAQIAELVASGASNADIAAALRVSEATVKAHLTKVYAKLDVRSRTQLAVVLGARG